VEKSDGYLFLFISLIITEPTAAVLALPDPQIAPKKKVAIVTTMPSPSWILPKKTIDISTIRLAIPPWAIIAPARIKRGMGRRVNESRPDTNFIGRRIITSVSGMIRISPTIAVTASVIPIGTR